MITQDLINFGDRTSFFVLLSTASAILTTSIIWKWLKQKNYFKKLNIHKGPTPLPFFGNILTIFGKGVADADLEWTKKYGKVFGIFEGSQPVIMVADTKFLKAVTIKNFNNFRNRRRLEGFASEEPFRSFLTVLEDDEWKSVRAIVTTTFTSGKLKAMTQIMTPCCQNILDHIDDSVNKGGYFDPKEVFGCYTLDIISSCCFGVSINALNDSENEFMKMLKKIFDANLSPRLILLFLFPKLALFLTKYGLFEVFKKEPFDYVARVSEEIIKRRKAKLEFRNDFIQMMIDHEANEKQQTTEELNDDSWKQLKKTLTNNEILSQSILFLTAGFDTTSTTLLFTSYNLAVHPECQEELCKEVDDVLDKYVNNVDMEMLSEMPYLDAIISETLRMYPPAVRADRVANADFEYEGVKIPKGSTVGIPIYAIHHDPEIYPEPEKFKPERFLGENKQKRDNDAYLPFGQGPRICVGMRFALVEMKLLLTRILSKYTFEACEKTPTKITLAKNGLTKPNEHILLKLKPRFSN